MMEQTGMISSIRPAVPPPELYSQTPEIAPEGNFRRAALHIGSVVAGVAVIAELSPFSNEGIRLSALTAMHESTSNAPIATAAYAGLTFAIEAAGALSAAYLMHQSVGTKALAKADAVFGKADRRNGPVRSAVTAFVLGSAAVTVGAHRRNPQRTLKDDSKYAVKAAAGVTAMTAPIGFALAEGMSAAGVDKVGTGILAAYGLFGATSLVRKMCQRPTYKGHHRPHYIGRHRSHP